MTFQNYLVKDGQAVPENPFDYRPVKDVNYQNIDWLVFETWKQSHTYQTNAPDGSWPVEAFDIVWQYKNFDNNWYPVHDIHIINGKPDEKLISKFEYRQFAKFKEEVEKPKESGEQVAKKCCDLLNNHEAAQSQHSYTEADLKAAWQAGNDFGNECHCGECDYCIDVKYGEAKPFDVWVKKYQKQVAPIYSNTEVLAIIEQVKGKCAEACPEHWPSPSRETILSINTDDLLKEVEK